MTATVLQIVLAIFAFIGAVWTSVQIYTFLRGRSRLTCELLYSDFVAPPPVAKLLQNWDEKPWPSFIRQRLQAFNAERLAEANPELMTAVEKVVQEEMNQAKSLRFLPDLRSFWILRLKNKGNTSLDDVVVYAPAIRVYRLSAAGGHVEDHGHSHLPEFTRITVGPMSPNHSVTLQIWSTESPSESTAMAFSVVHANGRATIETKHQAGGVYGWLYAHRHYFNAVTFTGVVGLVVLLILLAQTFL